MKPDYWLRYVLWIGLAGYGFAGLLYIAVANQHGAGEAGMFVVSLLATLALLKWLPRRSTIPDLDQGQAAKLVGGMIAVGILLRVGYTVIVPPVQLSDAKDYWDAALRLVNEGRYYYTVLGHEMLAFRPPGYPLLLALFVKVFGDGLWIPLVINLVCLLAASLATFGLALEVVGSRRVGAVAVALLALWPGEIVASGFAMTEMLSLALLSVGLWAYLRALRAPLWWGIIAGLCTGYGILVRPSLLFYPVVFLVFAFLDGRSRRKSVLAAVVASFVSIAVVSPWSVRNYRVFGEVVPVSTNGGQVFYLANNPVAVGGFTRTSERDLDVFIDDEVLWNRTGFKWGVEWIKSDPIGFLRLVPEKQAIFSGKDHHGVYWSLERGHGYTGVWYEVAMLVANGWWIGIMLLLPVAAVRNRRFLRRTVPAALMIATMLYLLAVHSVFQSQTRHHVPILAFLAIFAALAVWSPDEDVGRAPSPQSA